MKNSLTQIQKLSLALMLMSSASAFAQSYNVEHYARNYSPKAINDSGFAAGQDGHSVAIVNLATGFAHNTASHAVHNTVFDINKGALAVGESFTDLSDFFGIATLFSVPNSAIVIGALPGYNSSRAYGVNDAGWTVGYSRNDPDAIRRGGDNQERAFVWIPNPGTITSGMMYQLPCPAVNSAAVTVNNQGFIGGKCGTDPYIWWMGNAINVKPYLPAIIRLTSSRTLQRDTDYLDCEVPSIANSNAFVVRCSTGFSFVSFISTPANPVLTQIQGIGTGRGNDNHILIRSVNDAGCAVGASSIMIGANETSRAIKHCVGTTVDLNVAAATMGLMDALDINESGQIIAERRDEAGFPLNTVLLTPQLPSLIAKPKP